jgi:hypothetical protein
MKPKIETAIRYIEFDAMPTADDIAQGKPLSRERMFLLAVKVGFVYVCIVCASWFLVFLIARAIDRMVP